MRKILAFTLAETLIVMGIIGIVSALTLPNLNSSTGEKEKVAKVKKIYRDLTDAYGRATAVYGPVEEWFISDNTRTLQSTRFAERMIEFMKVSKNCKFTTNSGCFSKGNVLDTDGSVWGVSADANNTQYKIITSDGTSIGFSLVISNGLPIISIITDIDGPNKGKSQFAVDRFNFEISSYNGAILKPSPSGYEPNGAFDTTYDHYYWVIYNDNMDYLKCAEKLHWQNQTSCK